MKLHTLRTPVVLVAAVCIIAAAPAYAESDLEQQVRETERAFAKTMADRDHKAFRAMLSKEAIFFGPGGAVRGAAAVAESWKPLFEGPTAPFSWEPEIVEVLDSGTLALSSGPVRDPSGKNVGTFNSIWRLESDKTWRVIFDKGCDPCPSSSAKPAGDDD